MKEVARVVPHEAGLRDSAAIAAGLGFRLAHEDARLGMMFAPPVREAKTADARADDKKLDAFAQLSLASSFAKMRREIAIAQPYVLSTPKYDKLFDNSDCRREYGVSDA